MAGQPKAPFYFAVFLVVTGLVAFAAWRMVQNRGNGGNNQPPKVAVDPGKQPGGPGKTAAGPAEAADAAGITTVKEYTFKPSERLPAVKGTAAYKKLENNTVKFALNVWAGW